MGGGESAVAREDHGFCLGNALVCEGRCDSHHGAGEAVRWEIEDTLTGCSSTLLVIVNERRISTPHLTTQIRTPCKYVFKKVSPIKFLKRELYRFHIPHYFKYLYSLCVHHIRDERAR